MALLSPCTQEALWVISPAAHTTWTARTWPSFFQAIVLWSQEGGALLSSQNKHYCHSRETFLCLTILSVPYPLGG